MSNAAENVNIDDAWIRYRDDLISHLPGATYAQALDAYRDFWSMEPPNEIIAAIGLCDRFFLMTGILGVGKIIMELADKPAWIYDRCREVEANPDGCLDLWAREHYKSTIITFAGAIQEIAKDSALYQDLSIPDAYFRGAGQEITIGIFSHTTVIARDFVDKIRREIDGNRLLPELYPDVFWSDPRKESPRWSRDGGLICKRSSNPNEPTVSGWGLVDGLPTSKHFKLLIYDDVVTEKSVTTPDMINKTTEAWELSGFLSSRIDTEKPPRTWYIGTRYNFADTYNVMLNRDVATPRVYPATEDGTPGGSPVLLSNAQWEDRKKSSSTYIIACQMLQNPLAGNEQEFKIEWLRRYELRPKTLNVGILVDPASSKKKGTSNSAFAVIGIDGHHNKYLLDGAVHKMSLPERWSMLKNLRTKWLRQPGIQCVMVGYEKYGMQADIEHMQEMMSIENSSFHIDEINWPRDDTNAKDDRIRRLIPDHQNWKFYYPYEGDPTSMQNSAAARGESYLIAKPIRRRNHDGAIYNVVQWMIDNEYLFFPATTVKDMLDCMSRFYDLDINPPMIIRDEDLLPEYAGDV